ncbi:hypothetical protein JVU11DRAFT_2748 [Chiua virens]|nr:hypothetical protein JVU11DRAFT_2748 [Chiua virens]
MEKISDTVTSVFHIAIRDKHPILCSSGDGTVVWSDTFGLGWRFGISYNRHEWFAKVRLHLDHNHTHAEQNQATVTVTLRNSADKDAKGLKERVTTITNVARLPQPVTDPLSSTAQALRHSMHNGDFVDTKFYVFSAKRPGATAGKPRVVYANNGSIGMVLPKSTLRSKVSNGLAPTFMINMTSDHHIAQDSILHHYEYEQDSDLEDDDGIEDSDDDSDTLPGEFQVPVAGSSNPHRSTGLKQGDIRDNMEDEFPAEPPAYSVSNCRMILVKDVAYKTWATYIYFRYTGQVSFLPLKSAPGSTRTHFNGPTQPPRCSPKSMYRLADRLDDERMKELAFRAIKEGLSKDNVVEEAFTWFTAKYPPISKYEVEQVSNLRKTHEVSLALKLQMKEVSLGEKPWADDVLIAIMDELNPSEST